MVAFDAACRAAAFVDGDLPAPDESKAHATAVGSSRQEARCGVRTAGEPAQPPPGPANRGRSVDASLPRTLPGPVENDRHRTVRRAGQVGVRPVAPRRGDATADQRPSWRRPAERSSRKHSHSRRQVQDAGAFVMRDHGTCVRSQQLDLPLLPRGDLESVANPAVATQEDHAGTMGRRGDGILDGCRVAGCFDDDGRCNRLELTRTDVVRSPCSGCRRRELSRVAPVICRPRSPHRRQLGQVGQRVGR